MERIAQSELPEGLLQSMYKIQEYINRAGIDQKLLALIRMRVSQINSCSYCIDMHFKEGIAEGETALRLVSVSAWRETPYYSPAEQAVLAFAETLTRLPEEQHSHGIHDELKKHYSKAAIANLTLAIIQINSWNRLVRSFGTIPGKYQVKAHAAAN